MTRSGVLQGIAAASKEAGRHLGVLLISNMGRFGTYCHPSLTHSRSLPLIFDLHIARPPLLSSFVSWYDCSAGNLCTEAYADASLKMAHAHCGLVLGS